ncbi:MAG: hypothetical protein ACOYCB_09775 [Fastidiosipilaceae bacterium]|jgi:hypothetical protein
MVINVERLRNDLLNYYGTAMFNGFPMAVTDVEKVKYASAEELMMIAVEIGVDLRSYEE